MTKLYQNKYRNDSARLKNWDYRWPGAYFITICTHNREHFFGQINQDEMKLSPLGVIAYILWNEIKNHTPHVDLGAFVIMPNHIHGILILEMDDVGALHATPLHHPFQPLSNEPMSDISPKPGSVSTIIRSYKSAVTKYAHRLGFEFEWQTRFYDHLIRDEKSYQNISSYIINNPANWNDDKFAKNE